MRAQQNLVPNGSFEDTVYCPTGTNDPGALSTWYNPTMASPDYYNSCANNVGGVPINDWGYQYAEDGNAYTGLITFTSIISNYREYIQIKLSNKLIPKKQYCWSFWISLLDSCEFASNNVCIGLSNVPITNFSTQTLLSINPIGFNSQIDIDYQLWKQISGVYTANGSEEYLTIGNLFNDLNTNILYFQTNSTGGEVAYYYIDNVFFGDCISNVSLPNCISPNNDGINDVLIIDFKGISDMKIKILNRWGQILFEGDENQFWDGKHNNIDCVEGVYFYICTYKNEQLNISEQKTGFIQLIH
jgi:gliding motility-associated-like protein